jgi:hypothetical protein
MNNKKYVVHNLVEFLTTYCVYIIFFSNSLNMFMCVKHEPLSQPKSKF